MEEIGPEFFRRDPVVCSRELIGCVFRWGDCEGRIVETEAYTEFDDPACHTWTRPSAREFIGRHDVGTAYVYLNYGVHWLFNVLAKSPERSGFVLFRALEPLVGVEKMEERRGTSRLTSLCSGPGKLTRAFGVDGSVHATQFLLRPGSGIRPGVGIGKIVMGSRIGISRGLDMQWRFGEGSSSCLSRAF